MSLFLPVFGPCRQDARLMQSCDVLRCLYVLGAWCASVLSMTREAAATSLCKLASIHDLYLQLCTMPLFALEVSNHTCAVCNSSCLQQTLLMPRVRQDVATIILYISGAFRIPPDDL